MGRNLFEVYAELPKFLRRPLWRILHNYLVNLDKGFDIHFMNYGFAELDEDAKQLELTEEDERERYCINLYHQDVTEVEIKGKKMLEVGCGRGGGASYISRYLKPESYVGLDLSKKAIKYCNDNYDAPGLSFVQGKAEELPFEDTQFDAVVNVESSRCYSDMEGFLSEVNRVLKPGGHLLLSDMRYVTEKAKLTSQIEGAGFKILKEKNILPNVLKGLELDSERRAKLASEKAPKFLQKGLHEFSGVKGSERYRLFESGEMGYYGYVAQKPL